MFFIRTILFHEIAFSLKKRMGSLKWDHFEITVSNMYIRLTFDDRIIWDWISTESFGTENFA